MAAKETIQSKLTELEKNQVKKAPESKLKTLKKVAVRKSSDQPVKVDWAELEKETGLTKDWKNPAWNRAWKNAYKNAYNKTSVAREQKRLWQRKKKK